MPMTSVREIVDAVSVAAIEDRVDVSKTSVYMAIASGMFPAAWYDCVKELCDAIDRDCPRRLFRFKKARRPKSKRVATEAAE